MQSIHHDSVIRWRKNDSQQRESNARIVRWSDGSLQLFVGDEIFDTSQQDMMNADNVHLYLKVQIFISLQLID
jgi:RNA polymerase-associated protein LEO1